MTPYLRTDRLTLRPLRSGDCDALVKHLSDWSVMRWLSAPPWPYTMDDARGFIELGEQALWAIDDGTGLIGTISGGGDLGYWLARSHHGKGLMTEAVTAVLIHHFKATETSMMSGYMPGNAASRAVLVKHGFTDTGIEPLLSHPLGRETDIQRMELTLARWHSLRTATQ